LGDTEWRSYFRGTAAHNTVVVDGVDQSVSGGPFIWLRKAKVRVLSFDSQPELSRLQAEHDGYARLEKPVIHRREIAFDKRESIILVTDELMGSGEHSHAWYWHFAENVAVSLESGRVIARVPGWRIDLTVPDACDPPILLRGSEKPKGGWISRHFEQKTPISTVSWQTRSWGDTCLKTSISVIQESARA
jgi:hypothetical protein